MNVATVQRLTDTAWQGLRDPEAITLVGASQRITGVSITEKLLRNNKALGFLGPIHFVNPRRSEIFGKPTFPSIADVPRPVGAVIINLPEHLVLGAVREAIAAGASSLMIHAGGFAEAGGAGVERQRELQRICADAGIGAIGPNCLGFISVVNRVSLYGSAMPPDLKPGPIAAITQSGSVAMTMMSIGARSGMSFMASTGNEAVTGTEALGLRMLEDEHTQILLLFIETLRHPALFIELAERAQSLGKPVVALKVGLSERGSRVSRGHTGAMTGPAAVYKTALRDLGVALVRDFDELARTTELLVKGAPSQWRGRTAVLGTSGGKLALVADVAEDLGVSMADFTSKTEGRLREALHLPEETGVRNPLDVGTGFRNPAPYGERFAACLRAIADDPSADVIAVVQDLLDAPGGSSSLNAEIVDAVLDVAGDLEKRVLILGCEAGEVSEPVRESAWHAGVPVLDGARPSLAALKHASSVQRCLGEQPVWVRRRQGVHCHTELPAARRDGSLAPAEVANLLATTGLQTAPLEPVSSPGEAAGAVSRWGRIVLKLDIPGVIHKSDAGGVALNIETPEAAAMAYERLVASAVWSPDATVLASPQLDPGVELFLGGSFDPDFGALVTIGLGGMMVELHGRVESSLAPLDDAAANVLIERAIPYAVRAGYRGAPRLDVITFQTVIRRFSELVFALGDRLEAFDVNPIILNHVHPGGCAVDARLLLRGSPNR